jgi:hypothetical protein
MDSVFPYYDNKNDLVWLHAHVEKLFFDRDNARLSVVATPLVMDDDYKHSRHETFDWSAPVKWKRWKIETFGGIPYLISPTAMDAICFAANEGLAVSAFNEGGCDLLGDAFQQVYRGISLEVYIGTEKFETSFQAYVNNSEMWAFGTDFEYFINSAWYCIEDALSQAPDPDEVAIEEGLEQEIDLIFSEKGTDLPDVDLPVNLGLEISERELQLQIIRDISDWMQPTSVLIVGGDPGTMSHACAMLGIESYVFDPGVTVSNVRIVNLDEGLSYNPDIVLVQRPQLLSSEQSSNVIKSAPAVVWKTSSFSDLEALVVSDKRRYAYNPRGVSPYGLTQYVVLTNEIYVEHCYFGLLKTKPLRSSQIAKAKTEEYKVIRNGYWAELTLHRRGMKLSKKGEERYIRYKLLPGDSAERSALVLSQLGINKIVTESQWPDFVGHMIYSNSDPPLPKVTAQLINQLPAVRADLVGRLEPTGLLNLEKLRVVPSFLATKSSIRNRLMKAYCFLRSFVKHGSLISLPLRRDMAAINVIKEIKVLRATTLGAQVYDHFCEYTFPFMLDRMPILLDKTFVQAYSVYLRRRQLLTTGGLHEHEMGLQLIFFGSVFTRSQALGVVHHLIVESKHLDHLGTIRKRVMPRHRWSMFSKLPRLLPSLNRTLVDYVKSNVNLIL